MVKQFILKKNNDSWDKTDCSINTKEFIPSRNKFLMLRELLVIRKVIFA